MQEKENNDIDIKGKIRKWIEEESMFEKTTTDKVIASLDTEDMSTLDLMSKSFIPVYSNIIASDKNRGFRLILLSSEYIVHYLKKNNRRFIKYVKKERITTIAITQVGEDSFGLTVSTLDNPSEIVLYLRDFIVLTYLQFVISSKD